MEWKLNYQKQQPEDEITLSTFYNLKKREEAVRQNNAAILIQSWVRRWIIRNNLIILQKSATKIQTVFRGYRAKKKVEVMREIKALQEELECRNRMAIRIQSFFRGRLSRKYKFDFFHFKCIQKQNEKLRKSIYEINELEKVFSPPSKGSLDDEPKVGKEVELPLSETQRIELSDMDLLEALNSLCKISPVRAEELLSCAINLSKSTKQTNSGSKKETNEGTNPKELKRVSSFDLLASQFPALKERVSGVSKEKVDKLEEAIRYLKEKVLLQDLRKMHHLIRTAAIPGVFSDIYSCELTKIEKKLKEFKFWHKSNFEEVVKLVGDPKSKENSSAREKEEEEKRDERVLYSNLPNWQSPYQPAVEPTKCKLF